ncbi:MAG: plasmid stabilization protein [Desulfuromonadales bacterium C00003068]|jgi:toxin ParE1/3/4|nr:type II toxin-antitoxin system RelE/ParE family toxin [Deltaproteobacteria bacterium]OEU75148.1 MAG: plasmid stabilization protein [Desulfuromonadales bacterium C00003068]
MAQIVWTEPALNDLQEIAEYIELDDSSAAKKLVKNVFDVVERLVDFPDSGRRPPELKKTQYREKVVGPCRIFYRVDKTKVFILYILRSERNLRKYLLDERQKIIR